MKNRTPHKLHAYKFSVTLILAENQMQRKKQPRITAMDYAHGSKAAGDECLQLASTMASFVYVWSSPPLACHNGGRCPAIASPVSLSFWAEITARGAGIWHYLHHQPTHGQRGMVLSIF